MNTNDHRIINTRVTICVQIYARIPFKMIIVLSCSCSMCHLPLDHDDDNGPNTTNIMLYYNYS